jgi:chromate transporter
VRWHPAGVFVSISAPGEIADRRARSSFADTAWYFLRLGAVGFGGPAALAERMRQDLVVDRAWMTPEEFDLGLTMAAACPGPLAYQLAIFCGDVRHGARGAGTVAVSFAAAPFVLVLAMAAAYTRWGPSSVTRGLFYGAGPVVVALIARACWSLGRKTLHRSRLAWAIAASGLVLTWLLGREPVVVFLMAGSLGAWLLRPRVLHGAPAAAPRSAGVRAPPGAGAILVTGSLGAHASGLFAFFFKTGCLVFGSGLVIVPFLRSGVVNTHHWLDSQQFIDAVTIGLVSPGPVVITATFVGYLVDGLRGATAATAGMFLPALLFTLAASPLFRRASRSARLSGFVRGVTAAVVGVLAGTVPLVASQAMPDAGAVVIGVAGLLAAARRLLPDPVLVGAGAVVGAVLSLR